ncbi:MAG TPA: sulfurtransferase complex subunit TusB [Burkholderiaceae bacterium]|jgi:tRNA 2-thiouridine synthesizing protein B|nr:sulfurtransferase complex subunit TusB [Burkholderiaceae bacterium]HRA79674.1 sulfurtransferase complex subunit TusB [Burkholderiaceae bacterium]
MLHIVNKSPTDGNALDGALRLAGSGALLLIEDGVYAATRGNPAEARVRSAMERVKVYVLAPDLEARGMADRLTEGVTAVDYGGFVDLVADHPNCQSWL